MRLGALVGVLLLSGIAGPSLAEMGTADYAAEGTSISAGERQEMLDAFQAEAEATRARELEAERLEQARLAARPPSEVLVEENCTLCHDAGNYNQAGHTLVGWLGVIARMEWVNGAELHSGQRLMIARHLAEAYPASPNQAVLEIGGVVGIALTPALGLWWWSRPKRRRSRR